MSSHVEEQGFSELDFEEAAKRMRSNTSLKLSNEQKLEIYAYYKQATEGTCTTSKPGFFDFQGRAKWEAWNNQRHLSKEQAKQQYVELVDKLDPDWRHTPLTSSEQSKDVSTSSSSGLSGPVVSRMVTDSNINDIPDVDKTLVDWTSEGSLEKVLQCIKEGKDVNMKDREGMTPLHWACDRGHLEIVKCLTDNGADISIKDEEGQTPLHYATSCGHRTVITHLLTLGADVNILDNEGQSPIDVCDKNLQDLFQK